MAPLSGEEHLAQRVLPYSTIARGTPSVCTKCAVPKSSSLCRGQRQGSGVKYRLSPSFNWCQRSGRLSSTALTTTLLSLCSVGPVCIARTCCDARFRFRVVSPGQLATVAQRMGRTGGGKEEEDVVSPGQLATVAHRMGRRARGGKEEEEVVSPGQLATVAQRMGRRAGGGKEEGYYKGKKIRRKRERK